MVTGKLQFFKFPYRTRQYFNIEPFFYAQLHCPCNIFWLFLIDHLYSGNHPNTPDMELTKEQLEHQIESLNAQLTGDMFQDMDIKDQIHNLTMKLNGVKPMDSAFECVGCGS